MATRYRHPFTLQEPTINDTSPGCMYSHTVVQLLLTIMHAIKLAMCTQYLYMSASHEKPVTIHLHA